MTHTETASLIRRYFCNKNTNNWQTSDKNVDL